MSSRRLLWAVGLLGVGLGVAMAVAVAHTDTVTNPAGEIVAGLLIGWSFLGTGLYAWGRRPGNRVGPLMVATGLSWLLTRFVASDVPLLFSIAFALSPLPLAFVVHLLLAYPSGRLQGRLAHYLIVVAYLDVTVGSLLVSLFMAEDEDLHNPPTNLFLIDDDPGVADVLNTLATLIGVVLVLAAGYMLWRRWTRATRLQRRGLTPLVWTGVLFMVFLAGTLGAEAISASTSVKDAVGGLASVFLLFVPYAYLAGLLRSGYSRAHAVGSLVGRLNEAGTRQTVRDAMSDALGDPELDLIFKRRDRDEWVDARGRRYEPQPGRQRTEIVREGEAIGAIVHRPSLGDDPELLHSIAAAAALALENDRLAAELRARVAELSESRANIIAFGMAERRRLERDLHDGAQQRLVALSLQVNLARAKLEDDPATAATLLDRAREELRQALDELRELARGIHPAILTDQGLEPALTALAERTPVPVTVGVLPDERLPSQVEAVAYFVVAESLTNVAKYARANHASISVARADGQAVVEVRDDGVGGADLGRGTGLRGLADRVAALDGRLEIVSPAGAGTTVRAEIPCASS